MAKRKPTSRPRSREPQRPQKPRPAATPPPKPPREGPGVLGRIFATVRRFGFLIVLVLAVGGGIALGVSNGQDEGGEDFGDATTTTTTTEAPFQSNQDDVRGQPAKEVFAHTCGTCHTLRAAGVTGIAGPNLDRVVLTSHRVRDMIRTGTLDSAMPKNLLEGDDADRVARYVARVSRASRAARERE